MLPDLPTYLTAVPSLAGFVSLLLAVALPLVVAFLSKPSTPGWVKGVGLLVLAAVKTIAEQFIAVGHLSAATFYVTILNFALAVLVYFGLFKDSPLHNALATSGNTDDVPPPPTPVA